MIPPFTEYGYLPTGVHPARLEEIEQRFGSGSELGRVRMDSVRWMVDLAVRAGVSRIVLNGSFVTDIIEPNDVDCVLLSHSGYPSDGMAADELERGLPFLEVSILPEMGFSALVDRFFATDRHGHKKGLVEVLL